MNEITKLDTIAEYGKLLLSFWDVKSVNGVSISVIGVVERRK